ncbi:MAG: hypothetical protein K2Q20_13245 [Phycisphaerales bacterium]|nr:hypothetical protein [Phycisphaerales bacterium]
MSQFENSHVPAAPPIIQGELSRRPAQWPSVIGVIGIVLACLGLLTGLWTAATPLFMHGMAALVRTMEAKSGTPAQPNPAMAQWDVIARMGWWYVAEGLLSCAVWVWGLLIFIAIYKRRRGSMGRATTWAVVKITFNIFAVAAMTYVQWLSTQSMMAEMTKTMAKSPGGGGGGGAAAAAFMGPTMLATTIVGGIFGLLLYSAFPVFLLIYARTKAAREEAATW